MLRPCLSLCTLSQSVFSLTLHSLTLHSPSLCALTSALDDPLSRSLGPRLSHLLHRSLLLLASSALAGSAGEIRALEEQPKVP